MTQTLERYQLSPDVKARLDELRGLSEKAEAGDKEARKELRRKLRESSPAVVARASDVSRRAQHMLIRTAAAGSPLTEYALSGRLDMMREEIAGENPTPLETLLTEQIVSLWMLLELLGVLHSAYYVRDIDHRVSASYLLQMVKVQESAHRRFLASIQTLARVRKLQANTPGILVNTPINLR